jgi:hypothetical protein
MYVWDGKKYVKPTSDGTYEAKTPKDALKHFGLLFGDYHIVYSRKGYKHFTGRVECYFHETEAAQGQFPFPADFVLRVVEVES